MTVFRITEPGLYPGINESTYFDDPCPSPSLTPSIAKILLDRSPLHARYSHPRLETPDDDETEERYDSAKAIGNAVHAVVLGRGREIAEGNFDAWTTKEAKAFKSDALAAGKIVILSKHMARAHRMVQALNRQIAAHEAADAFQNGKGEVMLAWREGDVWFRTLIDWLHDDHRTVDDLKTTGMSAAPQAIPVKLVEDCWDIRAAFIERGLDALDPRGAGRRRFRFIAQENRPPFALTVNALPEGTMTMGRKRAAEAIEIWRECFLADRWPAYPPLINWPQYPPWAESRWLYREVEEDERRKSGPKISVAAGEYRP